MPLYVNDGESPIDAAGISQAEHDALNHTGLTGVAVTSLFQSGTPTTADVTYAMPSNTLTVDGDYVEVTAWGAITGGAGGVGIAFAGTTLIATVDTLVDTTNWMIRATILRTGSSAQQITATVVTDSAGNESDVAVSADTADLTAAQNIVVAEDGVGAGDAEVQGMIVRKYGAP